MGIFQNGNAIDQRIANAHGNVRFVFGNETNGGFQIRDGLGGEDYLAAHEATRLRTSSIETPLPASMSWIAASSERNNCSSSSVDISGSVWESSQTCKAFRSLLGSWATASWISASVLVSNQVYARFRFWQRAFHRSNLAHKLPGPHQGQRGDLLNSTVHFARGVGFI